MDEKWLEEVSAKILTAAEKRIAEVRTATARHVRDLKYMFLVAERFRDQVLVPAGVPRELKGTIFGAARIVVFPPTDQTLLKGRVEVGGRLTTFTDPVAASLQKAGLRWVRGSYPRGCGPVYDFPEEEWEVEGHFEATVEDVARLLGDDLEQFEVVTPPPEGGA